MTSLEEAIAAANLSKETIDEWVVQPDGRVNVHKDVIERSVDATIYELSVARTDVMALVDALDFFVVRPIGNPEIYREAVLKANLALSSFRFTGDSTDQTAYGLSKSQDKRLKAQGKPADQKGAV